MHGAIVTVGGVLLLVGTSACASGESGIRPGNLDAGPSVEVRTGPYDECGNGADDDGDGAIDEGCPCASGEQQACYGREISSRRVGSCTDGVQRCHVEPLAEWGTWGACEEAVEPMEEQCDGLDHDCDGARNEGCPCAAGEMRECGLEFVLQPCHGGTQRCGDDGHWSACEGAVEPSGELCGETGRGDGVDQDCDGEADEGCDCIPSPELCDDGSDNDCDGMVDEPSCGSLPTFDPSPVPVPTCASTVEVCGDAADNDGDGIVDEGCGPALCECSPEPGPVREIRYTAALVAGGPVYQRSESGALNLTVDKAVIRPDAPEAGVLFQRKRWGDMDSRTLLFAVLGEDGGLRGPVTQLGSPSDRPPSTRLWWSCDGYTVVFREGRGIRVRTFDSEGHPNSGETDLVKFLGTAPLFQDLRSAVPASGEFAVTWNDCSGGTECDSSVGSDMFFQRFNLDLTPASEPINLTTSSDSDTAYLSGATMAWDGRNTWMVVSGRQRGDVLTDGGSSWAVVSFVRDDALLSQAEHEVVPYGQSIVETGAAFGEDRFLTCYRHGPTGRARCVLHDRSGTELVAPFAASPTMAPWGWHMDLVFSGCHFILNTNRGTPLDPHGDITKITTEGVADIAGATNLTRRAADDEMYDVSFAGTQLVALNRETWIDSSTYNLEIESVGLTIRQIGCR